MALVAVASAKGAPGVTTLTVALAALTPGAIVAELDPDGGDLALRYSQDDGSPLDPDVGLLSLAASLRRDHTDVVGPSGPVDQHLQVAAGGLDILLGVTGPDQAVGLGPLWSPLARALAETGRTVFADCGRVGPSSPAMPVLMQAGAVLMLARAELEELAHLRERLRYLTATLPSRYAGPARIGVILMARERDRAAGPRTEQLLRASGLAVPVLGVVADDARGAARLRGLHGGRAGRTTLIRSVRSLLPAVTALTGIAPTVGVLAEAALTSGAAQPAAPEPAAPEPAASEPGAPAPGAPELRTSEPEAPEPGAPEFGTPEPVVNGTPPLTRTALTRAGRRSRKHTANSAEIKDLSIGAMPQHSVLTAEHSVLTVERETEPEPALEPAVAAQYVPTAAPDPAAGTRSPYRHDWAPAAPPEPVEVDVPRPENGWPRPGRGNDQVTGAGVQNWGS
jgi:hypothetical protein